MAFFLGIDGGGTKTRSIVGDEDSQLGRGSSRSSKVQRVGEACARDSLSAAIHQACLQAGISPREIAHTCAGVTGAARPEVAAVVRELISSVAGGEIEIATDVEVALEDAFGGDPGILVIAGTGAIAFGRNSSGRTARAGGLGFPVSDEGSGYWIGVEAVRLALHARDRGENPALLNRLMAGLGANDFDDFIVRVNATPSPDFAALSPTVLSSANAGDRLASEVLDRAGRELGRMAAVVAARLFGDGVCPVATHGGVLASGEIVRSRLERELRSQAPNAVLVERAIDPARGALERARRAFRAAGSQSIGEPSREALFREDCRRSAAQKAVKIVLASESRFRRRAMDMLGIPFETCPSEIDERAVRDEDPRRLTLRLAEAKAEKVRNRYPDGVIVAGDAVVARDGRTYEKPRDLDEAARFLRELSSNQFQFVTSLVVLHSRTGKVLSTVETSDITFRDLSEREIQAYIRQYDVLRYAGAFESDAVLKFAERISGSYNFVTALPVTKLIVFLREQGVAV